MASMEEHKRIAYGAMAYFTAGLSCEEAVTTFQVSHDNFPQSFPSVCETEVDFWYQLFKLGKFDVEQTMQFSTYPESDFILRALQSTSLSPDQTTLMKVCNSMKEFIESEERCFDELECSFGTNAIILEARCEKVNEKFIFNRRNKGCEIVGNNFTIESETPFVDAAVEVFRTTLATVNTKIGKLTIKHSHVRVNDQENQKQFITSINEMIPDLKKKLLVKSLAITADVAEEMNGILSGIAMGTLTYFQFNVHLDYPKTFPLSEVEELNKHLCHITEFMTLSCVDLKIDSFSHMTEVYVHIAELTPEELTEYKNKVLQNKNFKRHVIKTTNNYTVEDWKKALEPIKISEDMDDCIEGECSAKDQTLRFELMCDEVLVISIKLPSDDNSSDRD